MSTLPIISISTLELMSLKARANAIKKSENISHSSALEKVARDAGLSSWRTVSALLRLPFDTNEFHRILVHNTIITLWFSDSYRTGHTNLNISGFTLPDKPVNKSTMEYLFRGGEVWGDVTKLISVPKDDDWWICKYEPGQQKLNLPGLDTHQAARLASILGITYFTPGERFWHPLEMSNALTNRYPWHALVKSEAFRSLKMWSRKYPEKVRKRNSDYFPHWGALALEEVSLIPEVSS